MSWVAGLWVLTIITLIIAITALAIAVTWGPVGINAAEAPIIFYTGVDPAGMAATVDGRYIYVANSNETSIPGRDSISVLDTLTRVPLDNIHDASFARPWTITMNKDTTRAYVTNKSTPLNSGDPGTVTVIDTSTNTVVDVWTGFEGPTDLVFSADFTLAYVTNFGTPAGIGLAQGVTVSVVDVSTKATVKTITVPKGPLFMTSNKQVTRLYVLSYLDGVDGDGTLAVIDTTTDTVVSTLAGFFGPRGAAITSDDLFAYVSNFGNIDLEPFSRFLSVVSLASNTIIKTIQVGIQPCAVLISDDGRRVYVTNFNTIYADVGFTNLVPGAGTVSIIDTATNAVIAPILEVDHSPRALLILDGWLYVSNLSSNTVTALRL